MQTNKLIKIHGCDGLPQMNVYMPERFIKVNDEEETKQLIQQYERIARRRRRKKQFLHLMARIFFGKFTTGTSRIVFFRKNNVYKVARFNRTLKGFLYGWIANLTEAGYWKNTYPEGKKLLCPVNGKYLFGIIIRMPRCKTPVNAVELKEWRKVHAGELEYWCKDEEQHSRNFGYYEGRIVCIDYND